MTTNTEALTYDHIVALALENGFKLKPQVDGRMALNDYVIDFARAVYDIGHAAAKAETAAPVVGRWHRERTPHGVRPPQHAVARGGRHPRRGEGAERWLKTQKSSGPMPP